MRFAIIGILLLGTDYQQQVLQIFHYALKSQEFLLLDTSECVDPLSRFFAHVERAQKLYIRKEVARSILFFGEAPGKGKLAPNHHQEGGVPMLRKTMQNHDLRQEVDRLLLANYVPASVVVDAEMNILLVRGHTDPYLELTPRKTSLNLLSMAREGLEPALRLAISAARKGEIPVTKEHVPISAFGALREIRITVLPPQGPPARSYFLVLFEEEVAPAPLVAPPEEQAGRTSKHSSAARCIASLELATMRAEMYKEQKKRNNECGITSHK